MLYETYRPSTWDSVAGQDKAVTALKRLSGIRWGGRAIWISGQSGQGKTTLARLYAAEGAEPLNTVELDAGELTPARVRDMAIDSLYHGLGNKTGRAYIVNEAHGLRKDTIRSLLVELERIPGHAVWIFTTTRDGQESLFEDYDDAGPPCNPAYPSGFGRSVRPGRPRHRGQGRAEREAHRVIHPAR